MRFWGSRFRGWSPGFGPTGLDGFRVVEFRD